MSTGPAWSGAFDRGAIEHVVALPFEQVREWAFAGATGAGVKVAVIDSGVDADHPRVRGVAGGVAFELDADAEYGFVENEGPHGDLGRSRHCVIALTDGSTPREHSEVTTGPRPRDTRRKR